MLIKIMQYTAADPQRPGDLARLIRYLVDAKTGDKELDDFVRLAGPPYTRRLIQRFMPFGVHRRNAADDIAHQFFDHVRRGCSGAGGLPRQVYVHIVLSFSPTLRKSKARTKAAAEAKAIADAKELAIATAKAEAKAQWMAAKLASTVRCAVTMNDTVSDAIGIPLDSRLAANPTTRAASKLVVNAVNAVNESVFSRTSRIALDALENMGIGEHFPMFFVVHGDKRHVHAHAVVALFVAGSPPSLGFERAKKMLGSIAKSVDLAYGLPRTSGKLKTRHRAVVDSMVRLEF